jgi:hypothetical protein
MILGPSEKDDYNSSAMANLSWLQFVGYGFWILGAFFAFQAKTEVSGLGRPVYRALAFTSVCFGLLSWNFQDMYSERFSPRAVVTGPVVEIHEERNRGGDFSDKFLLTDGGIVARQFDSGILGTNNALRPIHMGDVLTVKYRVWDSDEVISITEISGQDAGWSYFRNRPTWLPSIVGIVIACVGLVWLLIDYRRTQQGQELTYEDAPTAADASDIQSLGL